MKYLGVKYQDDCSCGYVGVCVSVCVEREESAQIWQNCYNW